MTTCRMPIHIFFTVTLSMLLFACATQNDERFAAVNRSDFSEEEEHTRSFAEQGDANAQHRLGFMYSNGVGVALDYKEALKWYRLAAEQGDANAQRNLGVMYQTGQGVTQNYVKAHMWYNLSALSFSGIESAASHRYREDLAKNMTRDQLESAQEMAHKCHESSFKICD